MEANRTLKEAREVVRRTCQAPESSGANIRKSKSTIKELETMVEPSA